MAAGAPVGVKVEDQGVHAALEKLRKHLPLGQGMKPAFTAIGRALVTGAQLRFRQQVGPDGQQWAKSWRTSHGGGQTLSLSGRLRRSITASSDHSSATVGTNVVYAAIHQFGGVIRPRNGQFLAIPLTDAARKAGSPRNMPGLHVGQSLKGNFILFDAAGTPVFLLRKQVTIPARPFLGMSQTDRTEVLSLTQRFIERTWGG